MIFIAAKTTPYTAHSWLVKCPILYIIDVVVVLLG